MVSLSIENETELLKLAKKLSDLNIKYSKFIEPDFGNEVTSITIEPSEQSRKLTSSLPKLMKELGRGVPKQC